jgi:hypothetical protein
MRFLLHRIDIHAITGDAAGLGSADVFEEPDHVVDAAGSSD